MHFLLKCVAVWRESRKNIKEEATDEAPKSKSEQTGTFSWRHTPCEDSRNREWDSEIASKWLQAKYNCVLQRYVFAHRKERVRENIPRSDKHLLIFSLRIFFMVASQLVVGFFFPFPTSFLCIFLVLFLEIKKLKARSAKCVSTCRALGARLCFSFWDVYA